MGEIKLCKDCNNLGYRGNGLGLCTKHPAELDLVNDVQLYYFANYTRKSEICGPEAKLFEPKPKPKPPTWKTLWRH